MKETVQQTGLWIKRKARVERCCIGLTRARGCGRVIKTGESFYQHKYRDGLDHAEICAECGSVAGITNES